MLELAKHRIGARDVQPRTWLDENLFHFPVVVDHRVALRAQPHPEAAGVELEAERLGELAVAVGYQAYFAFGILRLSPCAHDKGVVDRKTDDLIDALGTQCL